MVNEPRHTLDEKLEEWGVMPPGSFTEPKNMLDWYAVANNDGIVAFFGSEEDALRYRLFMINRDLNP